MISTTHNSSVMTRLVVLALAVTLLIQHRAWAGEFTVHVPSELATIQQAINVAPPLDFEIIVAPGTYNEAIDSLGKSFHLRSSGGPEVTIIDASGLGASVVTVTDADSASPAMVIEGFTITGGDAGQGGGMFIQNASPTVVDCIFVNNSAALSGGAIYTDSANPTITGCTFENNSAPSGGAIRSSNGFVTVTSSIFLSNAANHGGAMHISGGSNANIDGCTFESNEAVEIGDLVGLLGGAILIEGTTSAEIVDSEFRDNTASIGGGIANFADGFFVLNTHFEDNSAGNGGGVFHSSALGSINGSTFANNTADQSGGGIFITPESAPIGLGGNFFCANQPDDVSGPSNQHQNEFSDSCDVTYHVPDDYPTIQQAIDDSANGTVIVVAPGTYNEPIDTAGVVVYLQSSGGPENTIINVGGMGTSAITIANGEGPDTIIEGFTFTGGQAQFGGGMLIDGTSPTVIDCIFINNMATIGGGIAVINGGSVQIPGDAFIQNNTAEFGGGVAAMDGGSVQIPGDAFIQNNTAEFGGGVAVMDGGSMQIPGDAFIQNNTAQTGGGIAIEPGGGLEIKRPEMDGATAAFPSEVIAFIQNNTAEFGGGLFNKGDATIEDALFENNQANAGGGVYNATGGTLLVQNTEFIGNSAVDGTSLLLTTGGAISTEENATTEVMNSLFCLNTPDAIAGPWEDLGGNQFNPASDLNCDGVVNVFDLLLLLENWGACDDPGDCPADLNGDGQVNVFDLLSLLENWG